MFHHLLVGLTVGDPAGIYAAGFATAHLHRFFGAVMVRNSPRVYWQLEMLLATG
jgi:hypothetical protein